MNFNKDIITCIDNIDFTSVFEIQEKDNQNIKKNLKEMLQNKDFHRALDNIYIPILSSLTPPPSINKTDITNSTNIVYLNNVYLNKKSIVKTINLDEEDEGEDRGRQKIIKIKEIIFEVIINLIFYNLTKDNDLSCPEPYHLYKDNNQLYYYQEQIDGKEIHTLDAKEMLNSLIIICQQLEYLQQQFTFSHRDFKSDNVLYNIETNKVYVIDFGYACISGLECSRSIKSDENTAYIDKMQKCDNKATDICFLILSIFANMGQQEKPKFIKSLAKKICKIYGGYELNNVYETFTANKWTPTEILKKLRPYEFCYNSDSSYSSSSSSSASYESD